MSSFYLLKNVYPVVWPINFGIFCCMFYCSMHWIALHVRVSELKKFHVNNFNIPYDLDCFVEHVYHDSIHVFVPDNNLNVKQYALFSGSSSRNSFIQVAISFAPLKTFKLWPIAVTSFVGNVNKGKIKWQHFSFIKIGLAWNNGLYTTASR